MYKQRFHNFQAPPERNPTPDKENAPEKTITQPIARGEFQILYPTLSVFHHLMNNSCVLSEVLFALIIGVTVLLCAIAITIGYVCVRRLVYHYFHFIE